MSDLDYNSLRHFADSWGLVAMFVFFIGAVIFVMRPGSKKQYDDAAQIPFKEDTKD